MPRLAGIVHDGDGVPFEEAAIAFVDGPVDIPDIAALTDDAGAFTLTAPVAGRYRLGVRAGERYTEHDVDVPEDGITVTITLEPR